ncbi:MAG: mandelate racemase/muconate lactonizing enzyme family protein [Planctomycetaceae bacterium]
MKIDHVETICLRFEYPGDTGFTYAGGKCTARVTTIVRVHADNGMVGIGSAYSHPALLKTIIEGQVGPLLKGFDPTDVENTWEKMYRWTRWYGRKGAAMSAIGAIDTALWDLRGKAAGKPVYQLLGGERNSCPAYASALLWKSPAEIAEEASRHVANGFRRMKMRLARSPELDVELVKAVRQAIGPDCDFMVDGSMRYNLEEAKRIGHPLGELNVFWFEEPFEPEDIDNYAALRGNVPVRIAAGENEFGYDGFRELIRAKAVDIVQPDASRCGGITIVKRVADLAKTAGLKVAPHSWSDAVAVTANAHVVATLPHGLTVEVDQTGNPFVEELLVEPLKVRDGILTLSKAPGLGIELKPDVIDRYRFDDPDHMPDGSYSDMVFGQKYDVSAQPYGR